jgi:Flp pilus assembly protein TadD
MLRDLAGILLAASVLSCGRQDTGGPAPGPGAGGYADAGACDGCHADIAASYLSVAMAQSFRRPAPADVIEDYTRDNRLTHGPSGFTYEMLEKNGRYVQRRTERGADGKPVRAFEREVTYVIGSGRHARSYLYRAGTGEMTQLPVTWYTQERAWGMSPGYDRPDQPDFFRPVTYTCLFCHDGYPEVPPGGDSAVAPQLFPPDLPSGIDCQRCHGPGARHVLLARSGSASFTEVRTSIVNPKRLPPERQMDICMQCHLETSSSGNWSGVVAFGRGVFSFRPGESLEAYIRHFDHPQGTGHDGKFEIAHQAYRLRQSTCFKMSAGRMTCTTCHDPHRRPADRAAHYNAKCLGCHAATECGPGSRQAAAGPIDCAACHMPARRTDDVVHVMMTDHLIRRTHPSREALLAPRREEKESYRGPIVFYRGEEIPAGPERDLILGVASLLDDVDRNTGLALLQKSIAALEPKMSEPYFQLGITLSAEGRLSESLAALERAAALAPSNARILLALGNALLAAGRPEDALARYDEAIAAWPDDAEAETNAGSLLARMGRIEDALRRLDRAIALRPDDAQALANRGAILGRIGRDAEAETALQEALRIRPGQPDACLNLVPILLARGDPAAAVDLLRAAARRNPAHPQLLARLAWILATSPRSDVRNGRESFERASAAVRLTRRSDPRALDALAAALAETGRRLDAARVAREARALAGAAGQSELAAAIDARRALYEKGLPYREAN